MTNDFIDERFPEDISFGAVGGPEYQTEIVYSASGQEHRNMNWNGSKAKYNVSYNAKNKNQIDKLIAFFRSKRGRLIAFRFKDWSDYQAHNILIGIGNDNISEFQLIKQYNGVNCVETRVITKPVQNSVVITINDEIITSEKFNVDYDKGIVTFHSPPKDQQTIRASFVFDVPVRFDSDHLPVAIQDINLYSCSSIPLIEVK